MKHDKGHVKTGLKVTQAADIGTTRIDLKADAVVVGSGAGGAVAAYELAKTGKKVIVLEAGRYLPSEKFPEMMAVSMGLLYQDHGMQANADGDITMLHGACVGGSTVVNAAVCFRIPELSGKWGATSPIQRPATVLFKSNATSTRLHRQGNQPRRGTHQKRLRQGRSPGRHRQTQYARLRPHRLLLRRLQD
jgi:choline dehydrogenase-like flavoprotein